MVSKKVMVIMFFLYSVALSQKKPIILHSDFDKNGIPPRPDYREINNWAALPTTSDEADKVPIGSSVSDNQTNARVDVFFLHPTIFTYQPTNQYVWNADVNDRELNQKVDRSTILNQASVFNGSCRVYAPRYRQAHYYSFITPNKDNARQALDLAYQDIKSAFEYYLRNWNEGRPIVIASHSQGTVHAKRLLKEFFDGKPLQKYLVEAYLIGIATQPNTFEHIKPSSSADDFGGFVSWNTYARNFYPDYHKNGLHSAISTNPLTWSLDDTFASKELNKGGVGLKFSFVPQATDAQNHKGMLWINKPYIRGRAFINTKIWHKADYNLFWMNIRENVALRIEKYFESQR